MKKTTRLFIFHAVFLSFCTASFAQEKKETLPLQRNETILNVLCFPHDGLVLKKGKDNANSKNLDWELYSYNPDLTLKYKVPLEKTQINKGFRNYLVTSPDAKYIYHIEPKGYNTTFGESSQYITQLDDKGTKKTFELEKIKDFGVRKAQFADSQFLYTISTMVVKDPATKKKQQKTMLIKLKNTDFSRKDIELKLPEIKDEERSTEWSYCGNAENKIYLMSKTVIEDGTFVYDVLILDGNGATTSKLSLDCKLDGVYPRPTNNLKFYQWADFEDEDFSTNFYTSSYSAGGTTTMQTNETIDHTIGAYGDIVIDDKSKSIYVYGLTGPNPYKRVGPLNQGYFIQKYDFTGKAVWKKQFPFGKEVLDNSFVVIHSTPYRRKLKFAINGDNSLKLQLLAKDKVYTFQVNADGKETAAFTNDFKNRNDASFSMAFDPILGSPAVKYLLAQDPKKTKSFRYNIYNFDKNDILLEDDEKENVVNLMLFKK